MGRTLRPRLALCVVAASLAACGDAAPEPIAPDVPASSAPRPAAAAVRAERPVAAPTRPAPSPDALRAMEAYAASPHDLALRARAIGAIVAAGAAGAEAVAPWLRSIERGTDPNRDREMLRFAAVDAMTTLGIDAVPATLAVLREANDRDGACAVLQILAGTAAAWGRTGFARAAAEGAWSLRALAGDDDGRKLILRVVAAAGADAAPVVDALLAEIEADPKGPWKDTDGIEDVWFDAAAPRLVELLANWELHVFAVTRLAHVTEPAPAAVSRVLAMASDRETRLPWSRRTDVETVARWAALDPRCDAAARTLLATGAADIRVAVLNGWSDRHDHLPATAIWRSPDDLLATIRLLGDQEDRVHDAANFATMVALRNLPDAPQWLAQLLDLANPRDAACLWEAALLLQDGDRDRIAVLATRFPPAFSSPAAEVRLLALRVLTHAPPELRRSLAADAFPLLEDSDPDVRAFASGVAVDAADPPTERIVAAALPFAGTTYVNDGDLLEVERRHAVDQALSRADSATLLSAAIRALPDAQGERFSWAVSRLSESTGALDLPPGAVTSLVRELNDPRARDYRSFGVLLRTPSGVAPALEFLRTRLADDKTATVLWAVRLAIAQRGAAAHVAPLLERLGERPQFRAAADAGLAALDPDPAAAVRRLAALLPGADDDVRDEVIVPGLFQLGPDGVTAIVRGRLPGIAVRNHAWWIRARGPEAARAAVAAARELTKSEDAAARASAIAWIGVVPREDGIALWTALVSDRDPDVRRAAFLAEDERPGCIDDLDDATRAVAMTPLLDDPDPALRFAAVGAVVSAASLTPDVVARLRALLARDPDRAIRAVAGAALIVHRTNDPAALAAVLGALRIRPAPPYVERPGIQWSFVDDVWSPCARAVARLGPAAAQAAPLLASALARTEVGGTERDLVVAIGAIGPAAAECVPILRFVLETRYARLEAVEALGRIGPAAAPALPTLRKLAASPKYADAVREAIRRIEASAK